ncbi:uncharacterized protein LOC128680154 [Plodia interpunctella]|uniref:uncharacterized protein LOC128680154 n=1 Tax=Plodia interpunctella TaxID=58824 RepID=UPI0023685A89|nr:uncharacterized protein LOC128680154 [Plodia interpunctella]
MNTKQCEFDPIPEPEPPTPCQLQKCAEKGLVYQPPPQPEPPTPADCCAICREKIKNPEVILQKPEFPIVCVVEREKTGTSRCDDIEDQTAAHPDYFWPNCPPPPHPPDPPKIDPCEEQRKRECLEEKARRMKRYLE